MQKVSIKMWVVIGLGLLLAVRSISSVVRLYKAGREVKMAQSELSDAESENSRLKGRLAEVSSDEFVLKEAKEKLGMGPAGEIIVISPAEMDNGQLTMDNEAEPEANWRKWWDLYIRI